MEVTIKHDGEKIQVLLVGHFTMDRKGYYAGMGEINNFQVYDGNDNITKELDEDTIEDLKSRYLNMCISEAV